MDEKKFAIIISAIALIISFASYQVAKKNISTGIRNKVYDEQIIYIKELYFLILEFSKYIDYSQPRYLRDIYLNNPEKYDLMKDISLKYYSTYYKAEIFLPKKTKQLFFNMQHQMNSVLNVIEHNKETLPIGDKIFEILRTQYFNDAVELLKSIRNKFHIKEITIQNRANIKM